MVYREFVFFFQAEDGIRDLVRSRGLGDVYKRQAVGELKQQEFQDVFSDVPEKPDRPRDDVAMELGLSLIHI